jgi:hypothetical protein
MYTTGWTGLHVDFLFGELAQYNQTQRVSLVQTDTITSRNILFSQRYTYM